MPLFLIFLIGLPIVEIFIIIKVGGNIGALNTVLLILFTAITGIYFAKLEGLNTLRSGIGSLIKNKVPLYEMLSGAAITIGAIFLIFPGFVTDIIGFSLIFPLTRNFIFKLSFLNFNKKGNSNFNEEKTKETKDKTIEGEFKDLSDKE